ncbi:unnamed protein product [Chrysoparadoxa australica]
MKGAFAFSLLLAWGVESFFTGPSHLHAGPGVATNLSMAGGSAAQRAAAATLAGVLLSFAPLCTPPPTALAISGGGLDYAGLNLKEKDFSKGSYKGKDFSGVIAKAVHFNGSDLRGSRFFKADLEKADFTGANLSTASLEQANLEGTVLTDAILEDAYLSDSFEGVGDISGVDFTTALMQPRTQRALCQRPDAKGTNPATGVDTRESLMCK